MKKFFYSQKLAPYVFILPFVLTVIFFWAVPIANGVLLSFQDVLQDKWVGLDNYKRLLSDKIFLKALANSTRYMIGTWIFQIYLFPSGTYISRSCRYDLPSDVW